VFREFENQPIVRDSHEKNTPVMFHFTLLSESTLQASNPLVIWKIAVIEPLESIEGEGRCTVSTPFTGSDCEYQSTLERLEMCRSEQSEFGVLLECNGQFKCTVIHILNQILGLITPIKRRACDKIYLNMAGPLQIQFWRQEPPEY
jgi:hypothetical protein